MGLKRYFFLILSIWELIRMAIILFFCISIFELNTSDYIPLLTAFLSGNVLLPFAALLVFFSPEKHPTLYPLCIAGKIIAIGSMLLGILFFAITLLSKGDFLLFFSPPRSILLIIFFVDLIFLVVLLSLRREELLQDK